MSFACCPAAVTWTVDGVGVCGKVVDVVAKGFPFCAEHSAHPTPPMCSSPGCDVYRSPIADGPAPDGWRCSFHEKPAPACLGVCVVPGCRSARPLDGSSFPFGWRCVLHERPASWLDDPLGAFDQHPDAWAYLVASDVFPRVEKAIQERYGPHVSKRNFRGKPVAPSANISPGTYMIARDEETLHAYATEFGFRPFAPTTSTAFPWKTPYPELATSASAKALEERIAKLEGRKEWREELIERVLSSVSVKGMEDLGKRVAKLEREIVGLPGLLGRTIEQLDTLAETVDREVGRADCVGCNTAFPSQYDLDRHVECMIHATAERATAIEKRLDVLDQIRRNEYPFSDVMSDPATFRPLWPMLEKAMVAAAAAAPAPRDEVALAAFEREAAEWKRRHSDALGKRMAESERIAVAKSARAEPTYTGWPVVTCARWSASRLFRARGWINAHPCTVSMASVAAVGGAALMALLR